MDAHWLGAHARLLPIDELEALRRSRHVAMRDGVPIAIDVYVPRAAAPVATILRQTRYARSLLPRTPFGRIARLVDHNLRMRRAFLAAGFAWVDADVRGSGASGGTQAYAWNPDEVADGAALVDWIVAQPWSNRKVGALGISYDGTCAEMLLVNRHPAVRAIAPLFSLHDVYTDVAFPGGVHLAWFTEAWGRFNALLDRNATAEAFGQVIAMIARARWGVGGGAVARIAAAALDRIQGGVRPVDGAAVDEVLAAHAENFDVHAGALRVTHRDDRDILASHPEGTIDSFSPHAFAAEIAGAGAAIYSYSGWRDAAYHQAAIRRHRSIATPGSRLTLGPWGHGGRLQVPAFEPARPAGFDHAAELVGFFAEHLQGAPPAGDGAPVHYFTIGEARWKRAASWPPPATPRTLFLGAGGRLVDAASPEQGRDRHRIDPAAGTGERSRWRCLIAPVPPDYPDRAARDRALLVFDGAPLPAAIEVTGHPAVTLHVAWLDAADGAIFAYLEDVAPDGRVAHVTEGVLRAPHRAPARSFRRADAAPVTPGEPVELAFELLPISYRFAAGHRVRLALAGADADAFAAQPASTIEVWRGGPRASRLVLPVAG
jgi:putative CocE/NonD family hydrolase